MANRTSDKELVQKIKELKCPKNKKKQTEISKELGVPQRKAPVLWKEYAVSLTTKGMQSKATSQYLTLTRIEPKMHVTYTRFSFQ